MTTVACPECASDIATPAPVRLSELIDCPECRAELEVITLSPLALAVAPEPEEDWGE